MDATEGGNLPTMKEIKLFAGGQLFWFVSAVRRSAACCFQIVKEEKLSTVGAFGELATAANGEQKPLTYRLVQIDVSCRWGLRSHMQDTHCEAASGLARDPGDRCTST